MSDEAPALLTSNEPRIPALDGLRGVAILAVMVFHMSVLADVPDPGRIAIDRLWLRIATSGWCGVDLFFVLSGFLITGILLDAKRAVGEEPLAARRSFAGRYFGPFYARRVLRIFPLYYAIVIVALLLIPHIPNSKSAKFGSIRGDEGWYWTLLSNWIIGYRARFRHGILDVTWSLSIEEQFYLVWPAVVLLVSRRALAWICGAVILTAIATRSWMYLGLHAPEIRVMTWTPCRMDALAAGAAVAALAHGPRGLSGLRLLARVLFPLLAALLFAYWLIQGPSWDGGPLGQMLGYTAIALCFAAVLILAATAPGQSPLARLLTTRPLRALGWYSYALYLFHFPLRALLRDTIYPPARFLTIARSQLPGQFLFYAMAMSLSFALAWLSWQLFERHFLKLKRFMPMPTPLPSTLTEPPAAHGVSTVAT